MIERDCLRLRARCALSTGILALSLSACSSDGDAQKAWNALGTCLAGSAANGQLAARAAALRSYELGSPNLAAKDGWPKRCGSYADDLYAALGTASETALLKTKLHERLGCGDNKGTCSPPTDSSLVSVATELWESASRAGLKTEVASGIPTPAIAPAPLLSASNWQSFSDKPAKIVGPQLTPDGRAILLLKSGEGRARPRGCEFSAGLAKVSCFDANAEVPELPSQTVDLVSDVQSIYVAGLTEKGLTAWDLKSGKQTDVRGMGALKLVHDGLAVEHGDKDQGFQLVTIAGGKAGKPVPLKITPVGDPVSLGGQVLYLQPSEGGGEFFAKTLAGGRVKDLADEKGSFSGAIHTCQRNSDLAFAVFGPRAGQHGAKPTAGEGKTRVTVSLFQGGAWTKPSEAAIPFERGIESDLVCSKSGASLAYAQMVEGGALVGRVDCTSTGCKASDVKLPGVESKWWWAVGPLGDKTLVMWRSSLGETRMRVAPLAALPTAKDIIVFDAPDFGGPSAAEVSPLYADDAALLVFRDEKPVALRVSAEGSVRVLTPNGK